VRHPHVIVRLKEAAFHHADAESTQKGDRQDKSVETGQIRRE
jgi:hypothetical protein